MKAASLCIDPVEGLDTNGWTIHHMLLFWLRAGVGKTVLIGSQMKAINELFEVSAITPEELSQIDKGPSGYRIPEYQRPYDWSEGNVTRLVSGMFAGLQRLSVSTSADAYTFLGTLLFVGDDKKESTFKGDSFLVVDGQQRITTLSLLAGAIIESLRIQFAALPDLPLKTSTWLNNEVDFIESSLIKLIVGKQELKGDKSFAFPRIVRDKDTRGTSVSEQELVSSIAIFLQSFYNYYSSESDEFITPVMPLTRESRKITENFSHLKNLLEGLHNPQWHEDNDCNFLSFEFFRRRGLKSLLSKLEASNTDGDKEINILEKDESTHTFYRTLLFAGYVCNCVGLTVVTTDDESAAFDIFDSLNTTGEPLSALEVLKPVVVSTLNKATTHPGYKNSVAALAFDSLEAIFEDENYTNTLAKQDETKRTIVTASLLVSGDKVAEKLSIQRTQVRKYFLNGCETSLESGEKFVSSLAKVAKFRHDYWNDTQHSRLNMIHTDNDECNELKFLFSFLRAINTTMALPVLIRFWLDGDERKDFVDFVSATRAVVAFIVLRRAATDKTDGIDTCFRNLMVAPKGPGFCTGVGFENDMPTLKELKKALRNSLRSKKLIFSSATDKDNWVDHCIDVPIYNAAQPLAKFLLLAAHHNTDFDDADPGIPKRSGVIAAEDREFLTYSTWSDVRYKSVEHIAPNSPVATGWHDNILSNSRIRNSLGNLTLLPIKENSHISNAEWAKKRLFFAALRAKTDKEREAELTRAQTALKTPFKRTTWQVVKKSPRLSILDCIDQVDNWDKEFVEKRSKRLFALAWDEIWPWIDD